jgi:protein ImuA
MTYHPVSPAAIRAQHPLLRRAPHRAKPTLDLLEHLPLVRGRVHEACGPARHSFALWLAAKTTGPVLWIAPDWTRDRLHPDGIKTWIDPARLLFVSPNKTADVLWCVEESLRAGTLPLIVAELSDLPSLTHVRRMHLAAEQGSSRAPAPPLGLLLCTGDGGAPGVETRWHLAHAHAPQATAWHLSRRRARTDPPMDWQVEQPIMDPAAPSRTTGPVLVQNNPQGGMKTTQLVE